MKRLFVDLDGVLADFDGTFPKLFGFNHKSVPEAVAKEHIVGMPDFFYRLEAFPGAREFFAVLKNAMPDETVILTACVRECYAAAAAAKHRWVREFIDKDVLILPVYGKANKTLFMQEPEDILIDDHRQNCKDWEKAGGQAILHRDFLTTLQAMQIIWGAQGKH